MESELSVSLLNDLWVALLLKNGSCWAKVISGSMYPVIKIKDHIFVEKVPQDKVRFGEIIVFKQNGRIIVHRVIGKIKKTGEFYFIEKGDANYQSNLVNVKDLIGRVVIIKNQKKSVNIKSGLGRMLQFNLACISVFSMRLRNTLSGRFNRKIRISRFNSIYNRFFLLLQRTVMRLFS